MEHWGYCSKKDKCDFCVGLDRFHFINNLSEKQQLEYFSSMERIW